MHVLYESLLGLSPVRDAELLDGYRRYASLVATALSPELVGKYARLIQETGEIRIFEELSANEIAALSGDERIVAAAVMADELISMENRRVAALLNQRGQHDVAPDLGETARLKELFVP